MKAALLAAALLCLPVTAHARPKHHHHRNHHHVARPAAWCGWWMGRHLGMRDRRLWLARNWARVGSDAGGPAIGAIVVWRHHVGIITGRTSDGRWIVKSGNDGHRVRERPRSVRGAIAFRWPHGARYAAAGWRSEF